MNSLLESSIFTAEYFGNLYKKNINKFDVYYSVYVKQIAYLLRLLGININTVPVLDIKRKKFHKIVDDRSFSSID